jgi:ATP-dependent exoDNAse (exonuclease V) alpha subunit
LTPYRNGIQGVAGLNELALAALGLKGSEGYAWLPRTPLMVTGNHYELGLFNGDTAIAMEDADGQAAVFRQRMALCGASRFSACPMLCPHWP